MRISAAEFSRIFPAKLKQSFADWFPPETEILHDGKGTVMVLLPEGIVTIRGNYPEGAALISSKLK